MNHQEQKLNTLLESFLSESPQYQQIAIPSSIQEKQQLLRALMNVRMPKAIDDHLLHLQDEYLKSQTQAKGIVSLDEIPTIKPPLSIWQGDITRLKVDAIVNAANSEMLGCFIPLHSCIDNQIHTYAGIQLRESCAKEMEKLRNVYGENYTQPTGIPIVTPAFNLPASHIIHVVGPIVEQELLPIHEQQLQDCYIHTLEACLENQIRSIAFCCISTGVFRFPNERAAQIAVKTVTEWLKNHPNTIDRVIFNVFKEEDKYYYEQLLR